MGPLTDQIRDQFWFSFQRLQSLALPLAILFAAFMLALGYASGKSGEKDNLASLSSRFASVGRRLAFLSLAFALSLGLRWYAPIALANERATGESQYSSTGETLYEAYSQPAPYVAAFEDQVFERSFATTPEAQKAFNRMQLDRAVQNPADLDPQSFDPRIKSTENKFVQKDGKDYLVRRVVREVEKRFPFDSVATDIKVDPIKSRRGDAFDLRYKSSFEFANPNDMQSKIRFQIAPPYVGAGVQDIQLMVNGKKVENANPSGAYEWLGTLGPRDKAHTEFSYTTHGAGMLSLDVAEPQRPVKNLKLKLATPIRVKFAKFGLQPTSSSSGEYRWELANAITHRNIQIAVPPQLAWRAVLAKLFDLVPLLVLFSALATLLTASYQDAKAAFGLVVLTLLLGAPMALSAVISPNLAVGITGIGALAVSAYFGGRQAVAMGLAMACLSGAVLIEGFSTVACLLVLAAFGLYIARNQLRSLGEAKAV